MAKASEYDLSLDEIYELLKHSYITYDVQQFVSDKKIQLPDLDAIINNTTVEDVKEKIKYRDSISLPYQLIPTLKNIGTDEVIQMITSNNFHQNCEYLERWRIENKKNWFDFTVKSLAESIIANNNKPPLLLIKHTQLSVIDGRTRLFLAYSLKKDIRCNII